MPYVTRQDVKLGVKWSGTETQLDALLDQLVIDVSDQIDSILGDRAPLDFQAGLVEDYDPSPNIFLRHRPVSAVTDVKQSADWTFPASSIVAATGYTVDLRLGVVRFVYHSLLDIPNSVRVTYDGGFEVLPGYVRRLAVDMATARVKQRDNPALIAKGNRDGNLTRTDPAEWDNLIARRLAPLMGSPVV